MRVLCGVLAAFAAVQTACGASAGDSISVLSKTYTGPDAHYQFGHDMGSTYKKGIQERLAATTKLHTLILPYINGGGRRVYDEILRTHEAKYPEYMTELRGVAEGAGVNFTSIFATNLRQEFELAAAPGSAGQGASPDHCTDYAVNRRSAGHYFMIHNEDCGANDVGYTFLANVTVAGRRFVAYTYMGDLATGAFGYVPENFAFTLNYVPPAHADLQDHGLGRGFISRALLDARDYPEALRIVKETPMIGGHNYQITNLVHGEEVVTNTEVFHTETYTHEIKDSSAMLHANTYEFLKVDQLVDWGSYARLLRGKQMYPNGPNTVDEAILFLGDTYNTSYPVFHRDLRTDLTRLWTLCTVHFNLMDKTYEIFLGNPQMKNKVFGGPLSGMLA